jgi:hypothetical protein
MTLSTRSIPVSEARTIVERGNRTIPALAARTATTDDAMAILDHRERRGAELGCPDHSG